MSAYIYICVPVCVWVAARVRAFRKHLEAGKKQSNRSELHEEGGEKRGRRAVSCCQETHTSNAPVPRRVWDHNFSVQLGVKPGSSSIDFFPGCVAVFLSANS